MNPLDFINNNQESLRSPIELFDHISEKYFKKVRKSQQGKAKKSLENMRKRIIEENTKPLRNVLTATAIYRVWSKIEGIKDKTELKRLVREENQVEIQIQDILSERKEEFRGIYEDLLKYFKTYSALNKQ